MPLQDGEVLIHAGNAHLFVNPVIDGEQKAHGLIPRDWTHHPMGSLPNAPLTTVDKIPRSEWPARIKELEQSKSLLSDIRNIGAYGQPIPSRDQNGFGYCLVAGTLVTMADGSLRPIERVQIDDLVMSHRGESRKVLRTMQRLYTGDMIGLSVSGVEGPLITTADHRILTACGTNTWTWVQAQNLSEGDNLYVPTQRVRRLKRQQETHLPVFCLEVEIDHSFLANGVVVSNCWAHSTVSAALLIRAKDNQPYADLSAYAIACIIKDYRDEGGWNGESMDFLKARGCPTSEFWPQRSTDRSNDKPETWANAALHKDTEWEEIPEGDFDTQVTTLILGLPHTLDLPWWSHSVCACDPVDGASSRDTTRMESGKLATLEEFENLWETEVGGGFGIRIWNSWSDQWGANGMGVLTESKARNNGAIALRVMTASRN